MEEDNLEIENGKVWLGEDGIIRIKTGENANLDNVEKLAEKFIDIARTLKTKIRGLIDIGPSNPKLDVIYRKELVKIFVDAYRDLGFEKVALWGAKNKLIEVIGSFVIVATGLKNIKYFKTEEEALKWVNEQ
jgi:hypothetical protein